MSDQQKYALTFEQFSEACRKADVAMKSKNGHSFVHILKIRCEWCGRSPQAKGRCRGWFQTFLKHLSGELTGVFGAPEADNDNP